MTLERFRASLADRYRIERLLGQGGMATVYLAADLKHDRKVAIKVLRPELAAALGAERFLREITTTASLRHPHILPLYDSGEANGFLYYVMPYIEGESLRDRMDREKQLPLDDALQIAREVADALSYAHSRGVVHRDIKPENILLESGHAVVADFGIARAVSTAGGETLTRTGMAIGTPQYMSPEQAAGEKDLDGRSDLYSLACVLYEMLAGQPPFTGPTAQAILARSLTESPRPLETVRQGIPAVVGAAIGRSLARSPADRFPTARSLEQALVTGSSAGWPTPVASAERRGSRVSLRSAAVAAGATGGLLVLAFAGHMLMRSSERGLDRPLTSIAVMPPENIGEDTADAYLGDGLTDELQTALAEVPQLRVAARSSALALRGQRMDVREIGGRLGVESVLEVTTRRSGDLLHVSVRLSSTRDGFQIFAQRFDRPMRDAFAVQEEIARSVVQRLRGELAPAGPERLVRAGTEDPVAHDLILRARFAAERNARAGLQTAIELARAAVQRDSQYATAWALLADLYQAQAVFGDVRPEGLRQSREAAVRAVTLDSLDSQAQSALGSILFRYDWDWAGAEQHLRRAIGLNPSLASARRTYARFLRSMGRFAEARIQLDSAVTLDPLEPDRALGRGRIAFFARDYRRALKESLADTAGGSRFRDSWIGRIYLELNDVRRAESIFVGVPAARGVQPVPALLALLYARSGQPARARRLLADTSLSAYDRAQVLASLGDGDAAVASLEQAERERDPLMVDLKVDPVLDPLRRLPRFHALMSRMRFPE